MTRIERIKLTELNPRFLGAGGEGIYDKNHNPVPEREGIGIIFNCPCGCDIEIYIPFSNPLDGGLERGGGHPVWQRTGETFEDMTLTPSILRKSGCGWHGFLTNGELISV